MKLDTFFEKFDQFADAPDAAAKMRELVLELAVRGRLLPGDPSDRSRPSNPPDPSAAPFPIPAHWQWATLESLGETKPRNDVPDSTSVSFVPMTLIPSEYGQHALNCTSSGQTPKRSCPISS